MKKTTKPCNRSHTITTARQADNIPLICTSAGLIHPVHSQPMSLATEAMPETRLHFCHFPAVSYRGRGGSSVYICKQLGIHTHICGGEYNVQEQRDVLLLSTHGLNHCEKRWPCTSKNLWRQHFRNNPNWYLQFWIHITKEKNRCVQMLNPSWYKHASMHYEHHQMMSCNCVNKSRNHNYYIIFVRDDQSNCLLAWFLPFFLRITVLLLTWPSGLRLPRSIASLPHTCHWLGPVCLWKTSPPRTGAQTPKPCSLECMDMSAKIVTYAASKQKS